jgi:hypothetical protein
MELSNVDRQVIRQALLLRQAQLRRSINNETDMSIMAIRQEQFRHIDALINTFRGDSK